MPPELKPCGTRAAYERHRKKGEPIDEACLKANRVEHQVARRTYARIRQRALLRLADIYPQVFDALLAEERAKEAEQNGVST